jgi:hypothetical protein
MGWGEGCIEDIFANAAEHFVQLIPSQVGVYFLGLPRFSCSFIYHVL